MSMNITITKTVTKTVPLHKQKAPVVQAALEELFEEMCEGNYVEFRKLLATLKPYVDECHEGHVD